MVRFNRAALFPTISANAGASSVRDSANRPFLTPNATTIPGVGHSSSGDILLGLDMSYEVDLWGRVRRTVAAARHEAQATAADLETARLSLQAELAMDYFELRAADAQKQLLDETVKAFEAALRLTTNRFQGGAAPKSDVAQAQTQLDTTRAQATDITVQRAQLEHAIATLIGKPPAAFSLPPRPLDTRPPGIPAGLPSQLLERRPDIAAAERRVAEANEQIGIAKAAYYPTLMLNASVGFEGSSFGNVLNASSLLWAVGASITQTIFDGGRRRATSDAVLAAYDATVAGYRQTTLTAFQQVEDNLAALRILEQEAQEAAGGGVGRAIAPALHQPLPGRSRQLSPSHHRADRDPHEPAQRDRHPPSPHGRQRVAGEGARRRLGRVGAAMKTSPPPGWAPIPRPLRPGITPGAAAQTRGRAVVRRGGTRSASCR